MAYCRNEVLARTRSFFDARAETWDAIVGPEHPARLRRIIESLPIAAAARILDVGCGAGVLLPILAPLVGGDGVLVAADVSFAMMRETGKRVTTMQQAGAWPPCLTTQADITRPPLREAFFDWVICNSCFPHFHDQQGAVDTMAQLLKPDGHLVVCHTESRAAINELHRKVGGVVGGHELPDDAAISVMTEKAGLTLETLKDQSDVYLLVARKTK